jgi:sulfite exporter TauE/SafE
MELGVAGMLILLGGRIILQFSRKRIRFNRHEHIHETASAPRRHTHWHLHSVDDSGSHRSWIHFGLRPFAVGIVHGAAGSAALMLLVVSAISAPWESFLYVLIFGVGSIAGMLLISALLAAPIHWARSVSEQLLRHIQLAAGFASCAFGIYLALSIL